MAKTIKDYEREDNDKEQKIEVTGGGEDKKSPLKAEEEKALIKQIENEFNVSNDHMKPKRKVWRRRLKLYNNQKRDVTKVGEPLIFTIFNVVIASLYDDRLAVSFQAREEGDYETSQNLNALAEYDHDLMLKDRIDYEWDWDAGFFGRGLLLLHNFNRDKKYMCPSPEVVDPLIFFRDPSASSVNGDIQGNGALRWWGREIALTKEKLENHPAYFNIEDLKKTVRDNESAAHKAQKSRDEAQGLTKHTYGEQSIKENYQYNLLEWWTHFKGRKVIAVLAENRKTLIRFQYLENADGEDATCWPLLDRPIFPMAHTWDGVSIPDLIEDKQRAKSVMINLGMESAKADLYPMYLFDKRKITNPRHLKFGFNKFIPVKGPVGGAITPVQKATFHQQVNLIMEILQNSAEKATAAPEVKQGARPEENRTLGETEIMVGSSDVRHSLSAKIFGWSERDFWRQWYRLYKRYFKKGIDEKVVRIEGALSPTWRDLNRDNIVARIDPDIKVVSKSRAEAERAKEYQEFSAFAQIAMQDPNANRRFINRRYGKILGMSKEEMTLMFPPTVDELDAEDENEMMEEGKLPKVKASDDDAIHIEIHNKVGNERAKLAHIEAHKMMMRKKKEDPELFQFGGEEQQPMGGFSPVNVQRQPAQTRRTVQGVSNNANTQLPQE